jgi:putative flavoprotein involved in K+ transport
MSVFESDEPVDVAIIGAGPAGLGCAIALGLAGVTSRVVLDRHEVGASFERWPREMRFITPSFNGNSFGQVDLNAITPTTSPAYTLDGERLTGPGYAKYLRVVAKHYDVPVETGVEVFQVEPESGGTFQIETNHGRLRARSVIWAAGEFQYPRTSGFPGAELCLHNSQVGSWRDLVGPEPARFLVIGGYESGIDSAIALSRLGQRVTVLDARPAWQDTTPDPSVSLSPYTIQRLRSQLKRERITLEGDAEVVEVVRSGQGFLVRVSDGRTWESVQRPILATGFVGSTTLVADLFEPREDGFPLLNAWDESTLTPGLFLSGPSVRHDKVVLCFVYKFRQRFAVVAEELARRLGVESGTEWIEDYQKHAMYLVDFSCCGESCAC